MLSHVAVFLIALFFLAKGADYFVEYSARIAKRLGVAEFIIGLTVTSIGTSLPELAASVSAMLERRPGIVVGSVVGSNIANIGLILGVSAVIRSFQTQRSMHDRDGYIMLASVILFLAFSLDNEISLIEAIVFLLLYASYLPFVFTAEASAMQVQFRDFMHFVFDFQLARPLVRAVRKRGTREVAGRTVPRPRALLIPLARDSAVVIVSGAAILIGAKYVISEAIWIAGEFGVPDAIIGLSLIAVGTSLPELLVSISAVRKKRGGILVGNIIGSNIANLLLIVGVCGLFGPVTVSEFDVVYTIPIMLFFSLGLLYFIRSNWRIQRWQGAVAVLAYTAFIVPAFFSN